LAQPPAVPRTLYTRAILVDTGAFVALADGTDANHEPARGCIDEIALRRLPVLVPLPVVFETHNRLLHSVGRARARDFLDAVYDGSVNLIRVEAMDEERARQILRRHADVNLTLTDASSMSVMERLGIGSVFSFDADFMIAGFLCVPPLPPL
jgi:predicted nucleic acid-binding protein